MKEIKISWSTDDIFMIADELGIELNEEEAEEILEQLYQNHDASIGICWDVIDSYIEQYQREKTETK
jgi:Ca2+-binding EF-hand superfamily protein